MLGTHLWFPVWPVPSLTFDPFLQLWKICNTQVSFPFQNNHVHGQPYTGPAAHHMNNPQRTGQRAQENYEGGEEVSPPQTKDQWNAHINWFHQDCAPRPYSPTFFCVWLIFQTRKTIPNQHGVESLFIVLSAEIFCQYITRLQWKVYSVL